MLFKTFPLEKQINFAVDEHNGRYSFHMTRLSLY